MKSHRYLKLKKMAICIVLEKRFSTTSATVHLRPGIGVWDRTIDHGTRFAIDGGSVFNRVFNMAERRGLSFPDQ
ncbi:hypothetical protein CA13_69600 [Planctomycetes bacterium CA13]|uniref:Uncharacterized protein n=1 Tax=Novipirellula herctigrandis TaxID=2527986 RepID=A0A5C5YNJ4_9BACT|nr:hypothetical protein CA13_69600 [Planctomycetes bacterium CA13]